MKSFKNLFSLFKSSKTKRKKTKNKKTKNKRIRHKKRVSRRSYFMKGGWGEPMAPMAPGVMKGGWGGAVVSVPSI